MSDESMARKRELEEEQALYPPLAAPNLYHRNRTDMDSPIIPLSPDPFGRFPSQAESVYMEDHPSRDSQVFQNGSVVASQQDSILSPPDRISSLTLGQSSVGGSSSSNNGRSSSHTQTPSSRFSFDSTTSEDATKLGTQKTSSSLMSVKSIRKLWRKSGKQQSISGSINTIPESGRTSPNVQPSSAPQSSGRLRSRSVSKQMLPPTPPGPPTNNLPVPPIVPAHMQAPYQKMTLDGDSRYPVHPLPPRDPSPMGHARMSSLSQQQRPPSSQQQRPPSVQHQRLSSVSQQQQRPPSVSQQPSESKRESGVRKSILKSWKSATGLSASSKHKSSSSTSTPRSSTDQPPEGRRRRPSVVEMATGMRSSVGASSILSDIPPSPALPEQYANLPHSRASSRQSQMTLNSFITNGSVPPEKRPDSSRRGLSVSSFTTSSPPRGKSPLTVGTSPPRGHMNGVANANGRLSDASWDERPSFDVSQFEMVSPPKPNSHYLETTLSYPYHGLDHSMTSAES